LHTGLHAILARCPPLPLSSGGEEKEKKKEEEEGGGGGLRVRYRFGLGQRQQR